MEENYTMDNSHLKHELYIMAQAVITVEQQLRRLEVIEAEIHSSRIMCEMQMKTFRNTMCGLLGAISANNKFEDFATTYPDNYHPYSHITYINNTTPINYQGNGFGNQSTPKKSKEIIIEEIKAMIVELKIKGSVRERPDGRFEYRSALLGSIYGFTKEELEDKITKKLKEVKKNKGKPLAHKKIEIPLLSEFFITQYLPYKKQTLKESSIKDMQIDENFVVNKAKFDKPLDKYTTANIEMFLYSIPQTRKRQKVRGLFNNILTYAKRMGLIKANPCDNVEKMKHQQELGEALSFQEQRQFFDNMFAADNIELNHKLYFAFVYLTGTRRSEAIDITTKDVDFENNTLHIPGTKTKGSNRTIPLFPLVKTILQSITPNKDGKYFPIKVDRVDSIMRRVKDNTHTPHELRHTFGTIKTCVEKLDPKTVSLYMGHTTTSMTLNRYTHPEQLDKALFYNGALSEEEKRERLRQQYQGILDKITTFLCSFTQ